MIQSSEVEQTAMEQYHENLFGGNGKVYVQNLVLSPVPAPFTEVVGCRLEPNGKVGLHYQEHFDELVIVTRGTGTAEVDGVCHRLGKGSVVGLALGAGLSIVNESEDSDLEYLIVKASSHVMKE